MAVECPACWMGLEHCMALQQEDSPGPRLVTATAITAQLLLPPPRPRPGCSLPLPPTTYTLTYR